ncbi:MAG TPA: 23S rRNA (adenine(2503)-C(2))-methyltransferase RlmN [Candidatus Sulfobium mesophilum]|nr:23S rRNA (adenine(2503)-C(2))-methyltransferase RlmN [Candidatus Sulfobium mesophilum]
MRKKLNLKSFSKDELFHFIEAAGLPRFRAGQLIHWIYQRYATDISCITEFSKELRSGLERMAYISDLKLLRRLKSSDGTEKFLFSLEDAETIESVLIPDDARLTLCISSQVGCAMGCKFCLTGKLGLIRNLRAYEIADQVIAVNRLILPQKITNIVMMGMGEPLANLDEVAEALWRITEFIDISKRRITLSTAGLVPGMALLADMAPHVNLAVSLNASSDKVRDDIMPINRRYPLKALIEACKKFPLGPRRRITFEYVLIGGVNDSPEDAGRLVKLVRGLRCKINLIPLNPHPESGMKRPSDAVVLKFQKALVDSGLTAFIRESKGQDILAACGQLRAGH